MKQLQWSFGINAMPMGRTVHLGRVVDGLTDDHIDYGQYGGVQAPYVSHPTDYGYTVPAGHVLGLTSARLDSKFAWRGHFHLPTMRLRSLQFGAGFNGSALQYPDVEATLAPTDGEHNTVEVGVESSSYLILGGTGQCVMDWEPAHQWRPPFLLAPGRRLYFVVTNAHGAQNMNAHVQGLLAPIPDGVPLDEVFPRLGVW